MAAPLAHDTLKAAELALSRGDLAYAELVCERLLAVNARDSRARYTLGLALGLSGRTDGAIAQWRQVLQARPRDFATLVNLGVALSQQEKYAEAIPLLRSAIRVNGAVAQVHFNLGNSLLAMGELNEAIESLRRAIAYDPKLAPARNSLGVAYRRSQRQNEAVQAFIAAIEADDRCVEAHGNLGIALLDRGELSAGIATLKRALQFEPGYHEAAVSLSQALLRLRRFEEALQTLEPALRATPGSAELWRARGQALEGVQRFDEALESLEHALRFAPADVATLSAAVSCGLRCCDWTLVASSVAQLRRQPSGLAALHPFVSLSVCDDPREQLQVARARGTLFQPGELPSGGRIAASPRIRVGYLSSDLRDHAVAHLLVGVLDHHDRARFEVHAVSLQAYEGSSAIEERLRGAVDGFHKLGGCDDREAIRRLRALELDLAMDLNGHTVGGRPGILAARVAPVQVSYLGYAGTTGLPNMDYLIADSEAVGLEQEQCLSERVVRLPRCYLPNDNRRGITSLLSRSKVGLPEHAFVFCAFTQPYKISEASFNVWMRLLSCLPASVLWLKQMDPAAHRRLQQAAMTRGISSERLITAPHVASMDEHLGRQSLADLYLDTVPYNAHSSACDALWAGLPVLTCAGRTFASRVAASVLNCAGLPELITQDLAAYEHRALELARNASLLADIRRRIAKARISSPLFDTPGYTRDLESAIESIHRRAY